MKIETKIFVAMGVVYLSLDDDINFDRNHIKVLVKIKNDNFIMVFGCCGRFGCCGTFLRKKYIK